MGPVSYMRSVID